MGYLEEIRRFYEQEGQEEIRLSPESVQHLEFLTAVRYLERYLPAGARVLDNCAGTGIYAFHLAHGGHSVTAGDMVAYNVDIMRDKQREDPALAEIYCGDAMNLSRFEDGSFDAVLNMGALYHLHDAGDRAWALRESVRVLRPGGLLYATYMNRYAVIWNNLQRDMENIDEALTFAKEGKEGIFYASTAGEAEALMEAEGLAKLAHVALDGMACFLVHTAGLLSAAGFEQWKKLHFETCEDPSLLGSSYHNLLVGVKR